MAPGYPVISINDDIDQYRLKNSQKVMAVQKCLCSTWVITPYLLMEFWLKSLTHFHDEYLYEGVSVGGTTC